MSWYDKLFNTKITEEYKVEVIKNLKDEFQIFYKDYEDLEIYKKNEILNQWYYSADGQKELLRFIENFWKN